MIKNVLLLLVTLCFATSFYGQEILESPNGHVHVEIRHQEELTLEIALNGSSLIKKVVPKIIFDKNKSFGTGDKLRSKKTEEVNAEITATIPTKSAKIKDHYKLLTLNFKAYDFEVRAYNNGVSYRFISRLKNDIEVADEQMDVELAQDFKCYLPEEKELISHFENYYKKMPVSAIKTGTIAGLPILFTDENGISVSITESNLFDYPNLFLEKSTNGFKSLFPHYVLETEALKEGEDRLEAIKEEAPFIARTKGKRNFPWRVFMISENDKQIVENNLVYQLAAPKKLEDISWIKPGKVAWDWWNDNNVYGVDFKSGLNTETYKYYIDFASEFGLEYIVLDEGWSKSTLNVMEPNPDINMEELTTYAKNKGVGIILWSLWRPLDENMESLLSQYAAWGITGGKSRFYSAGRSIRDQFL